jgi:hypothetical protein
VEKTCKSTIEANLWEGAGGVRRQVAEMRDDAKTILADESPADVKLPCGMGSTVFLLVEVWFFLNGFNKNINHRKQRSIQ